jgi:glycosyltransferase involved in cell wall biosynthesis
MRVLIAHSFYRLVGGEDRYVQRQMRLLEGRHDVHLLAHHNTELSGGARTAARMTFSRRELERVERTVAEIGPDLIHIHNVYPSFGPAVHLAARKLGVPLLLTVHNFRLRCPNGFMFTEGSPCRRCEKGNYLHATLHHCFGSRAQAAGYATALWAHRFVLRTDDKIDLFITPSAFVRNRLLEWGFDQDEVVVVRNFAEPPEAASPKPGDYGVNLGRMSPEKGLDGLLRALHAAGDPPFVFIGSGPILDDLKAMASALGLTRTEFRGQLEPSEVAPLLRGARYVALPSTWDENAPLAALEAMAEGRPLLVTRTGGLPELVEGGEGLMCDPGDVATLARHIADLMSDDELCRALGGRGLERARAEFTPASHLAKLEQAYEVALSSARRPVRG